MNEEERFSHFLSCYARIASSNNFIHLRDLLEALSLTSMYPFDPHAQLIGSDVIVGDHRIA